MEAIGALVLGVLLLGAVLVAFLYLSRQRALAHRVGSFACGLRPDDPEGGASGGGAPGAGRHWAPGIAQYASGRLLWWRAHSLAPRPAHSWSRSQLTLVERIALDTVDDQGRAMLLVRCRHGDEHFQLTMSVPACAGLVSWLEAGPRPVGRVI